MPWRNLRNEVKDILWIVKNCLTTFWFWVPVLFYVSLCVELYLMACVNPLLALVLPGGLVIYAVTDEKRRMRLQYGLKNVKEEAYAVKIPDYLRPFHWRVEKSVEEYEALLKKDRQGGAEEKKDDS